jgi:adenylate cyclase
MTMPLSAPNPIFFERWWPRRRVRPLIRPDGERLRDALAREERVGYRYVLYGWLFALLVVSLYLLATIPLSRTIYYLGIILVFAAVGLAGEWIRQAWPRRAGISMGAILLVQISLLTAVLIVPDPLIANQAPPQIAFRTANFLYLYAFVIGTVLSYSPVLMLWAGLIAAVDWSISFWIVYRLPDTVSRGRTSLLNLPDLTLKERLAIFLDPHYMSFVIFRTQVLLLLLTSAILAFAVWRSRRLVLRQMVAESAHANLARYFSPDIVGELAAGSYAIDSSRAENVGVLFVDVVGFTALTENLAPERAIALLRSFHTRMSDTVFRFGGTVDKYIGDEVNGDLRYAAKARRRRRAPVRLRLRDDRRDRPLERKARAARCRAGARRDRHSLRSGGARQCRRRALSRIHCHRRHRQCGQPSRTPDPRPRVRRGGKPRGDRSI